LSNIGSAGFANHFQLDFLDLVAANRPGPDIVFFDARFSPDRYEIAVGQIGGPFSSFLAFEVDDFVDTGVSGPVQPPGDQPFRFSPLFGLPLELDDFGLPSNSTVSALRFRSLPLNASSTPQGDPVMAAALNAAPIPEPAALVVWSLVAVAILARRRWN
jgi:hypothetical protein